MYNDNTYGFNLSADKSNDLYKKIVTAATNITKGGNGASITSILYHTIIIPVSSCWYTKEGKDYFDGFAGSVNNLSNDILNVYNAFIDDINKIGEAWREQTGNDFVRLNSLTSDDVTMNLNTDVIKEHDPNGAAVIDVETLTSSVIEKLPETKEYILDTIKTNHAQLEADENLIGGQQAQALQELFTRLAEIIGKIFDFLTEDNGEHLSLRTSMNNAAQNQKAAAEAIANKLRENGSQ